MSTHNIFLWRNKKTMFTGYPLLSAATIQMNLKKIERFYCFMRLISGPSCSKLTTSLVNDSLKFTSSDTQIC